MLSPESAISNVSEEAKERAAERLESMRGEGLLDCRLARQRRYWPQGLSSTIDILRTLKRLPDAQAALSNPNVSEEAKEHSAEVLGTLRA